MDYLDRSDVVQSAALQRALEKQQRQEGITVDQELNGRWTLMDPRERREWDTARVPPPNDTVLLITSVAVYHVNLIGAWIKWRSSRTWALQSIAGITKGTHIIETDPEKKLAS